MNEFIKIKKYREEDGTVKNYFDNPTKVDEFYCERFLFRSIPDFSERINSDADYFKYEAGYFDFTFGMTLTETSTLGHNIKNFIKPQHNFNAKFVVWIHIQNKEIGGVIDLSSVRINWTPGAWTVNFTCYGLAKEFSEWCGAPNKIEPIPFPLPGHTNYTILLTSFIKSNLFISKDNRQPFSGSYFNCNIDNLKSKWDAELGWNPVFIGELWNNIIDILKEEGRELDSGWLYFLDLVQILGFSWKFEIDPSQAIPNWFKVNLVLYYRDQIFKNWGDITGRLIEHIEKTRLDAKKYLIMPACKIAEEAGGNNKAPFKYGGAIAGPENYVFVNDGEYKGDYEQTPNFMQIGDYPNGGNDGKIKWEGWRTSQYDGLNIDDCRVMDVNIFKIHNTGTIQYNGQWFFYNRAKKENGDPSQFALSLARLCVKEYSIDYEHFGAGKHLITDDGWLELLELSVKQYPFLYLGDKTVLELEIGFNDNQAPSLGDEIAVDGYRYFISDISGLNLMDNTMRIQEAIEINSV